MSSRVVRSFQSVSAGVIIQFVYSSESERRKLRTVCVIAKPGFETIQGYDFDRKAIRNFSKRGLEGNVTILNTEVHNSGQYIRNLLRSEINNLSNEDLHLIYDKVFLPKQSEKSFVHIDGGVRYAAAKRTSAVRLTGSTLQLAGKTIQLDEEGNGYFEGEPITDLEAFLSKR